jgi:hypothetical protein
MRRQSKPDKFPLRLHATGQWMKKIGGRSHYFGTDRDKALALYVRDREDLEAGRVPRPRDEDAVTVRELANQFLHARRADVESGELSVRQWDEYRTTCETLVVWAGPADGNSSPAPSARAARATTVRRMVQTSRGRPGDCPSVFTSGYSPTRPQPLTCLPVHI